MGRLPTASKPPENSAASYLSSPLAQPQASSCLILSRQGETSPTRVRTGGCSAMSPSVGPAIATQSCAGSRQSLLPCHTIKVWLSVGPYCSQGSAWVSSSTMDGSGPTPDLPKGSPETYQKPHGTWFAENLYCYGVPGAAMALPWPLGPNSQVSAQDLGHLLSQAGYDSISQHMSKTRRLLAPPQTKGSQISSPTTVAGQCLLPRLVLRL